MKYVLLLAAVLTAGISRAQLPNNGFEQTDTGGRIAHWGNEYGIAGWFDLSGQFHSDSVVVDGAYFSSTTDAKIGSRALELRNGYNYTKQTSIAGAVHYSDLPYQYSTFSNKIPVSSGRPTSLRFYYRFLPAGADTAWVYLTLDDSTGSEIATAEAIVYQGTSGYALMSVPIMYTDSSPVAFVGLHLSTCQPNGTPTFGTRFLVDDVALLPFITPAPGSGPGPGPGPAPTTAAAPDPGLWRCYPTAVTDRFFAEVPAQLSGQFVDWHAVSGDGRTAAAGSFVAAGSAHSLSLAQLAPGLYLLTFQSRTGSAFKTRVLKL